MRTSPIKSPLSTTTATTLVGSPRIPGESDNPEERGARGLGISIVAIFTLAYRSFPRQTASTARRPSVTLGNARDAQRNYADAGCARARLRNATACNTLLYRARLLRGRWLASVDKGVIGNADSRGIGVQASGAAEIRSLPEIASHMSPPPRDTVRRREA